MSPSRSDLLLALTLRACALAASAILLLIVHFLIRESVPALRNVGPARFFGDPSWHPTARAEEGTFNIVPMLIGTLAATIGAVLVATPLGIGSAVFCRFYAPAVVATPYRRMIELLAGIPSVVYGFWGLMVLAPLIAQWRPPGPSLLAGIVILAIMILPTMALSADAALAAVSRDYLRAAAALGLSRWGTIRHVAMPAARNGMFTGMILQTSRAIGETMAVLMVCGNVVQTPGSLFDPIRTLTANIALEMAYAMGDHRSALFVCGLLLILVVGAFVLTAETAASRRAADGSK